MTTATPGYGTRIDIWFQVNNKGRKVAYRWSPLQFRSFRMSLVEAELLIAQGQADKLDGNPFPRPAL